MFAASSSPYPHGHPSPADSPYGYSTTPQSSSTPSNGESHFDPHDPAWFTPSLPSSSSSAQLPQGGFAYSGMGGHGPGGFDAGMGEETEVLAFGYEDMPGFDGSVRRYSEGDQYAFKSGVEAQPHLTPSALSDSAGPFFDSSYTLAPPSAVYASSSSSGQSPAPVLSSSAGSSYHFHPSFGHFETEVLDLTQDAEMTSSPTTEVDPAYAAAQRAPPRATYGSRPSPHEAHLPTSLDDPTAAPGYSLNVVTTQTYEINYARGPSPSMPHQPRAVHPHEGFSPYPRSVNSATPTGYGGFVHHPPTPQRSTTTPSLQPSPFIASGSPSTTSSPHPRSARSSGSSSSGTGRARRPSLAHAHTQPSPISELGVIQQGIELSDARHHSFSGSSGSGSGSVSSGGARRGSQDEYRRHSLQSQQYSPYPPPHSPARRRSSANSQHGHVPPSPASLSAAERRRSSNLSTSTSNAPATPSQLARDAVAALSLTSPAQSNGETFSPYISGQPQPLTPSRRTFAPSPGIPTTPQRNTASPSTSTATPSSASRRNNRNLTISVDAASALSPSPSRSSNPTSRITSPTQASHVAAHYSPYSPYSPTSSGSFSRRQSQNQAPAQAQGQAPPTPSSARVNWAVQAPPLQYDRPPVSPANVRRESDPREWTEDGTAGSSLAGYAGGYARGPPPMVGGLGALGRASISSGMETPMEMDEREMVDAGYGGAQQLPPHARQLKRSVQSASVPPPQSQQHAGYPPQHAQPHLSHSHSFPSMAHPSQPALQPQQAYYAPSTSPDGLAIAPDGTVGLGLEMGVEEMHLANQPPHSLPHRPSIPHTPTSASGIVAIAPAAFGGVASSFAAYQQDLSGASSLASTPGYYGDVSHPPQPAHSHAHYLSHASSSSSLHHMGYAHASDDPKRRLEREIREYLSAENRLDYGERTIVVMNPKIAQRSYGTEKRLLAPPPMALLLGASWWTTLDAQPATSHASSGALPSPTSPLSRVTLPPEVFVSISTDKAPLRVSAGLSWMSREGKLVLERDAEDAPPLSGRAMSKSLAVSVPGELNKDVSTTVTTVVSIAEPGEGDAASRVWAMVQGKPITVISKPSKKKSIAAGSTAGLTHGALVSLYNRTKAYSGSTRYLATSGVQSMFPLADWRYAAGPHTPRTFAPNDSNDVRLTAKTNTWDAFVIYAVDLEPIAGRNSPRQPHPNFPKPPANALPLDPHNPKPLYYNQTVVLQDIATGVASPIFILRRCDPKGLAVGGGSVDGFTPHASEVEGFPHLPDEELGEPVSQYRPIALEMYQDPARARGPERMPPDSFCGVNDDEVGVHPGTDKTVVRPAGGGGAVGASSQPVTPTTPGSFAAMQSQQQQAAAPMPFGGAEEDVKLSKRPRRTSSTNAAAAMAASAAAGASAAWSAATRPQASLAKSKKRGQSTNELARLGGGASVGVSGSAKSPKVWTITVPENCIWSIVNVDVERHTFYVPPSVEGGKHAILNPSPTLNPLYTTPRPFAIGPNFPQVFRVEGPLPRSKNKPDTAGMFALHGDYFTPDYTVWVGSLPCPTPPLVESQQKLLFRPPPPDVVAASSAFLEEYYENDGFPLPLESNRRLMPAPSRRISLVRGDGIVFPTPFSVPMRGKFEEESD
ncbi:hypothetical protein JCM10207_005893 [Rhodosporidiobolus poonsookiae]